jgi:hypothetical protein
MLPIVDMVSACTNIMLSAPSEIRNAVYVARGYSMAAPSGVPEIACEIASGLLGGVASNAIGLAIAVYSLPSVSVSVPLVLTFVPPALLIVRCSASTVQFFSWRRRRKMLVGTSPTKLPNVLSLFWNW